MEYLFEDGQNLNHKKKSWFKIMKLNEKKSPGLAHSMCTHKCIANAEIIFLSKQLCMLE